MPFLTAAGRRIEYQQIAGPATRPVMVFLHEGLGSVSMWRDFPARCAQRVGCPALVYSRYGYGQSNSLIAPRGVDYLHEEALRALPEILDQLEIERPVLLGHSDGASIALVHAGGTGRAVAGVVALAPHVFVEPEAIRGIAAARLAWQTTPMREKLARFHRDVDSVFAGWYDIWTSPEFLAWNIEGEACSQQKAYNHSVALVIARSGALRPETRAHAVRPYAWFATCGQSPGG